MRLLPTKLPFHLSAIFVVLWLTFKSTFTAIYKGEKKNWRQDTRITIFLPWNDEGNQWIIFVNWMLRERQVEISATASCIRETSSVWIILVMWGRQVTSPRFGWKNTLPLIKLKSKYLEDEVYRAVVTLEIKQNYQIKGKIFAKEETQVWVEMSQGIMNDVHNICVFCFV